MSKTKKIAILMSLAIVTLRGEHDLGTAPEITNKANVSDIGGVAAPLATEERLSSALGSGETASKGRHHIAGSAPWRDVRPELGASGPIGPTF